MFRADAAAPNLLEACHASLALGFADDLGTTRLVERRHSGPLRVQKPLYPEGRETCHAIVVHPPGGVVGGDSLEIRAQVGDSAAALLSTPGAAKWYKANGRIARQDVSLALDAGAALEWLPQETIFFNQANVELTHAVEMAADARYLGAEILCFGRTASGETFDSGSVKQRTSIRIGGRLIWFEQGHIENGPAMQGRLGLGGHTVCATLIAAGGALTPALLAPLRELGLGATFMKQLLVVRHLGDSSEQARRLITQAWKIIRPAQMGREAIIPRIWQT